MVPTRLTVWLLFVGLLLWLTGWVLSFVAGFLPGWATPGFFHAATGIVLGFDAGLLLMTCGDAYLARRYMQATVLSIRRERPARLSLGIANEVTLIIDNHSHRRL